MRKLLIIVTGLILVLCYSGAVHAQAAFDSPSEYTADEVAENQGAVAYWYAWGFNYAFGRVPVSFKEMKEHGLPMQTFSSPHIGADIDFDDGSLDFDGDMLYARKNDDVEIRIQTTKGVMVLPGTLTRINECCEEFCCDIRICQEACWDVCGDEDAACQILKWMMWKSFETHKCRYAYRPVYEAAWLASGFAPVSANWRELAPNVNIELVYGKCALKKAYVKCCTPFTVEQPCEKIDPCSKSACASNKQVCGSCDTCISKSSCTCGTCLPKTCSPAVSKPVVNSCNKWKPQPNNKCSKCLPITCTPACNKSTGVRCSKCKPKCTSQCNGNESQPASQDVAWWEWGNCPRSQRGLAAD